MRWCRRTPARESSVPAIKVLFLAGPPSSCARATSIARGALSSTIDERALTSGEDRRELVRRYDLELSERAIGRTLVLAPAPELSGVAEAAPLHVVVGDLRHELGAERLPGEVLPLAPAALRSGPAMYRLALVRSRLGPGAPRMVVERPLAVGREEVDQLATFRRRKARADPDMLQRARVIVEAKQQRADGGAVGILVP